MISRGGTFPGTGPIVIGPPIVTPDIVDVDGTDGPDTLKGDENHNLMRGFGGDDRMFGFAGDDLLIGGSGADFLDGGTGTFDTAGYMDSNVGVLVNLELGFGRNGTAQGDVLVNVDDIIGSPHSDTLIGNTGSNRLMGEVGDDFLTGGLGPDFLFGGDGGNPPPSPADGNDTAVYSDSPVGVTVNLATGRGFGGTAEGDTLLSIENLVGSAFNDNLIGNDVDNAFSGGVGDDLLKGAGGADFLVGDQGSDTLKGGGGADLLVGGAGIDTASYTDSPVAVFVSLITRTTAYGDAEGDVLDGIENLTGSSFTDNLWGDDGANVINGMAGNDTLKGFGGDDTLNGEAGADLMYGNHGNDTYLVDNAGDRIRENSGQSADTVRSSVSYVLTAGGRRRDSRHHQRWRHGCDQPDRQCKQHRRARQQRQQPPQRRRRQRHVDRPRRPGRVPVRHRAMSTASPTSTWGSTGSCWTRRSSRVRSASVRSPAASSWSAQPRAMPAIASSTTARPAPCSTTPTGSAETPRCSSQR